VALLHAIKAVDSAKLEGDERTGAQIIERALQEPLRQLAENAGLEGSVVVNDVRKAKKGHGLNADTGEIVDLVAAGVIEPAMGTRSARQNAASIAQNILTTAAIVAEIENTDSDFDREKLQERLAKLSGGVAVIKVGAATETEMKEKKHRVEDALQATRAALEEGIVPGGGVALLHAIKAVDATKLEGDERTGAMIVQRALQEPLRQLAANAGLEGSVVVNDVRAAKAGQGLNVDTGEIVDLVKAGIIDPAMVTRSALQNAASIAKNILTTEAVVAEAPEKQAAAPMGGGMPDMM